MAGATVETESGDGAAARHKERVLKRYRRVICGEESVFEGIWEVSGDGGGCAVVTAGDDDDDNIIRSSSSQTRFLVLRVLRTQNHNCKL